MKYFFDTEFIEDGKTIDLISIGISCEDGRDLYLISNEFDESKASEWVKVNVLDKINKSDGVSRRVIKGKIIDFVADSNPEFWAYYADYDWIVLCQIFGRMIDLPDGWPMYCRDLKQLCDDLGNPKLPNNNNNHHALDDANWCRIAYNFLMEEKRYDICYGKYGAYFYDCIRGNDLNLYQVKHLLNRKS